MGSELEALFLGELGLEEHPAPPVIHPARAPPQEEFGLTFLPEKAVVFEKERSEVEGFA